MRIVRDGLPLENAQRTQNTWLGLKIFLATAEGVVRFVRIFIVARAASTKEYMAETMEIFGFRGRSCEMYLET